MGKSYNTDKRDKFNKNPKRIKRSKDTYKNRNKWTVEDTELV
jgi:hypothetical protein